LRKNGFVIAGLDPAIHAAVPQPLHPAATKRQQGGLRRSRDQLAVFILFGHRECP
jgi:hypothetical protein